MIYRHKQRGMTLVEMVISIVIVSIAMTAMLTAFSTSMGRSADPLWKNKSLKLAQAYLDEILSKPYDEGTPTGGIPAYDSVNCATLGSESGESRALFDDVDDYKGLTDSPPRLVTGAMTGYDGYGVVVDVVCAGSEVGGASVPNDQSKRITITITPPNQSSMPFSVYRGNF